MLQFDFKTDKQNEAIIFKEPKKLITAYHPTELANCWNEVEEAIKAGFYVAGYVTYEVAYSLFDIHAAYDDENMPLLSFGVFEAPSPTPVQTYQPYNVSEWKMVQTRDEYASHFRQVMSALETGTTEQVNYTVSFTADFTGDAYHYYQTLKNAQQASYSAYLQMDNKQILSVSPELFFHVKNDTIKVKPMKGTIKRGHTFEEDIKNAAFLRHSEKNKTENKIITDLMMDELREVAKHDTIHVSEAFTVEKYPTVYQMTSTVEGELSETVNTVDVLQRLFPCGSISGAPKKETLQLIHDIETDPRHVYCGAIGYFTPDSEAIFNVPIRTVIIDTETNIATYGAGGAITAQSTMEDEYEEVFTKTKVLSYVEEPFELLETFGLYDGRYIVFEEHLQRLKNSASYFGFSYDEQALLENLSFYKGKHPTGIYRVRLTLAKDGTITSSAVPLTETDNKQVIFAKTAISTENRFLYHKTTNRTLYDAHKQPNVFDVLLWNEAGEVTEFTIGNVVLEIDGKLYTPPVSAGLLPGTFREKLVREGIITEKTLYKEDFTKERKIWLINSVRQWVEVIF